MTPEQGQQSFNNLVTGSQALVSNYLMAKRQDMAQKDLSLREKTYQLENQLKGLQIQDATETLDFNRAKASSYGQTSQQFGGLQSMAIKGDVDGLLKASYTPIEIPGYSKIAQDRLNSENEANFRAMRMDALSKSSVYQTRMGHIEATAEYGTQLADKPFERELLAELQTELQQGISISQLPPEKVSLLNDAVKYKTQKALVSNPSVAAAMLRNEGAQKVAQINAAGRIGAVQARATGNTMAMNVQNTIKVLNNLGTQKSAIMNNQTLRAEDQKKAMADVDTRYKKAEKAYQAAVTLSNLQASGSLTPKLAQQAMASVGLPVDTMTNIRLKNKNGDTQTFQIPLDMLDALEQKLQDTEVQIDDLQIDMGDEQLPTE
jgi:hypothetical protein